MKNIDVVIMVNAGILNITENNLPAKSAYKVVKFRSALNKAFEIVQNLEKDLLKDIGIDDPQQFDKEIEDLKSKTRTEEESNKLSELLQKQEKYNKLHFEMFNDEAKIVKFFF